MQTRGLEHFVAEVEGAEVHVLLIGIGGKKPWLAAARAISDSKLDLAISTGLAGGLKPEHKIGEVLVAEKVLSARRDVAARCDLSAVETAVSLGAKRVSCFYNANHVVLSAAEKRETGGFADAVEMEGFNVLAEGAMFAEKVVAIRAISDTVEEDLPLDFNRVTTDSGEVSLARVLRQVTAAPWTVPALLRFGRRSKSAAQELAGFLERYVRAVVESAARLEGAGSR